MNDTASTTSNDTPKYTNDKNVLVYKKKALKRLRNGKNIIINVDYNVYGTGLCGNIRNAVTGKYYVYKVGTADEYKFFKVISTIGHKPITLFYASAGEYELHQQQTLSDAVKNDIASRR